MQDPVELRRSKRRSRRHERGAVAILMALVMTALLVVTAMVLDFGLVRVDRQVNKSAADAAAVAGVYGLDGGDGQPHPYIGVCQAMRYLAQNDDRFSGVTDTAPGVAWSDGNGASVGNGCRTPRAASSSSSPGCGSSATPGRSPRASRSSSCSLNDVTPT